MLSAVDLSIQVPKENYSKQLPILQAELRVSLEKFLGKKKSLAILFEGWDAAGKGGAIKRLTERLDPRIYEVHGIAKPNEEELARHYLWRFWKRVPPWGRAVIFDRSWYGRVLVERIEGFALAAEWQRAYQEINEFEAQLISHGVRVIKFFLHISPAEQMRRFEERQNNPLKGHKITEEDWRNRDRLNEYLEAYDEMFARTNTLHAPWNIVAAENKYHARLNVIEKCIEMIK
ncbi:MAG: UDP-galactose-lipid carrier transferase [Leptospiraceae bacterium]|nr:UDP-galactose-lipid carrier transferase [Leptospiraceae bacterium]